MVLKVMTEAGGWAYFDGISRVNTSSYWGRKDTIHASDEFFIVHSRLLAGEPPKDDEECQFKRITILGHDGLCRVIIFNTTAYLLSDEGKTIDRI